VLAGRWLLDAARSGCKLAGVEAASWAQPSSLSCRRCRRAVRGLRLVRSGQECSCSLCSLVRAERGLMLVTWLQPSRLMDLRQVKDARAASEVTCSARRTFNLCKCCSCRPMDFRSAAVASEMLRAVKRRSWGMMEASWNHLLSSRCISCETAALYSSQVEQATQWLQCVDHRSSHNHCLGL
jgi:hypothetical protein